jgi:hypothetical protein
MREGVKDDSIFFVQATRKIQLLKIEVRKISNGTSLGTVIRNSILYILYTYEDYT